MIIKVSFSDNDFQQFISNACEQVLFDVTDEYPAGEESIQLFKEYLDKEGIENLKQRIVLAATGNYIASNGFRGRFDDGKYNSSLNRYDGILKYLDDLIKIEQVKTINTTWQNGEVCIINLWTKIVSVF